MRDISDHSHVEGLNELQEKNHCRHRLPESLIVLSMLVLALVIAMNPVAGQSHLEPIEKWDVLPQLQTYHEKVQKILIRDKEPVAYMLVLPSFTPEYALILRKVSEDDTGQIHYEIESAVAEEQIWNITTTTTGRLKLKLRKNTKIKRQVAEIEKDAAEDIINTWKAAVANARPPKENAGILDGVTYEFFIHPDQSAMTYSPSSDLALKMKECGDSLMEYIEVSESERPAVLEKVLEINEQIRKAIN